MRPCVHIPAEAAGLVLHAGSGAIVAFVTAWTACLVDPIGYASSVHRIQVGAEQKQQRVSWRDVL